MPIRALGVVVALLSVFLPTPGLGQTASEILGDPKAESYRLFMVGRHLEGEGDIDGAIRAFQEAAALDPETGEILAELAALHARRNEPDEAIRVANQALQTDPDNLTAHRILGLVHAGQVRIGQTPEDLISRAIDHLERARGGLLPDLQIELTLARLYLTVEQAGRAIDLLEELIEDEPGLTDAGLLLSDAYEREDRLTGAVEIMEGVIGSGRPSSRAIARLGELYGRIGRWSDAVLAYERAAARNPRSSGIQRELANALVRDGRADRAREVLQQLSTARPDDVSVLYQLSEVELDLGNFQAAEAAARQLMDVEPNGIRGPFALAEVYARQHDYRSMINTLEAFVEARAGSLDARGSQPREGRVRPFQIASLLGRIGFAHEQLQDPAGAIHAYTRAVDLVPSSLAYGARLVQAYLDAGRLDEAEQALETVRQTHPGDLTVVRLEARVLGDRGDVERGGRVLRDMLAADEHDPMTHLALAAYYSDYGRLDDAADVLETADARFPNNPSIVFQLGAVLEQSDRFADAERAFRRVLAQDPDHAASLNYLGYMLADRGERLEESVGLLQRAIEIDPHNGAYLDSLGWAYFKLERLDLAEPHLREASEQMVWNSVIQDHLGDLMYELGRFDEAIAAWDAALAGDGEDVDVTAIERKIQQAHEQRRR